MRRVGGSSAVSRLETEDPDDGRLSPREGVDRFALLARSMKRIGLISSKGSARKTAPHED
jgi:hypothetical protein